MCRNPHKPHGLWFFEPELSLLAFFWCEWSYRIYSINSVKSRLYRQFGNSIYVKIEKINSRKAIRDHELPFCCDKPIHHSGLR